MTQSFIVPDFFGLEENDSIISASPKELIKGLKTWLKSNE